MEELDAGVRDLHERVARLDELLQTRGGLATDLSEKLGFAAMESAETVGRRQRWLMVLLVSGLLLWTPATAYGAVWLHEKVRNNCYPVTVATDTITPHDEPWYCGLFPGTDHPEPPRIPAPATPGR